MIHVVYGLARMYLLYSYPSQYLTWPITRFIVFQSTSTMRFLRLVVESRGRVWLSTSSVCKGDPVQDIVAPEEECILARRYWDHRRLAVSVYRRVREPVRSWTYGGALVDRRVGLGVGGQNRSLEVSTPFIGPSIPSIIPFEV